MSSTNRITGMYSGLDTESLITSLVAGKKTKVETAQKEQMTLKYKQDAWTDLNKKIKNLFTSIGDLRYEGSYTKYTTNVSNSNVASVMTNDGAMLATQSLKVKSLAQAGYMTGGKMEAADKSALTSASTLEDIGITSDTTIDINGNSISLSKDMTINDVAKELSKYGVTAKFDSAQQRMYISATETGKDGDFTISGDADALKKLGLSTEGGAHKLNGTDAKIELNGVEYTSNSNVFSINGLTITAKQTTKDDETVTLDTTKDSSGVYDMIKKFIKQYSELINEMDKLYNTKEDKGYKPLTDEEKSALSDYEVEKWDNQLKDQALSKDSNLYDISQAMEKVFSSPIEVGEKTYYLSDFGVETASYFNADDNEKHALHIYGDEDDSLYSSETNKLKNAITTDPDTVAKVFSTVFQDLYKAMDAQSARVANFRSYGSFFDDVKLKSDYTSYNSKISDLEQKLTDYEDKWYKKFSKMETAMSKMQSSTSALSSFTG